MNSKVVCEIIFKDPQSEKIFTIVGKVRENQIFSLKDSWISVSNIFQRNGEWKNSEHTIHKPTIEYLIIIKTGSVYVFDKESLVVHKIILNKPLPVSIC